MFRVAIMGDQETKPAEAVEAVEAPVEAPAADSDVKIVDAPAQDNDAEIADAEPEAVEAPEQTDEKTDEKASTEKDAVAEVEGGKAKTTKKLRSIRHPPEGMLKTSGVRNSERKKNIKFDPSTLPETDNPDLIRTQVRGNKNPICAPVYNS